MVYFDHNATTPLFPKAQEVWLMAQAQAWMNPSSPYRKAANVHAQLEAARARLADCLQLTPKRIVFNSGASEGNHAIFNHLAATLPPGSRVGVSPTEHASLLAAAHYFFPGRIVPLVLDASGRVDRAALQQQLSAGEFAAVSVMAANNETGIVNPWREIAADCKAFACGYHCDASQWVGKMPLVGLAECDFVSAAAHKFGGPKGVGFCLLPSEGSFHASIRGGQQEAGRRAGTENVASILAMVAALELADARIESAASVELPSREQWRAAVPGLKIVGGTAQDLWNTRCLVLPKYASARWVRALERREFLCGAGSACSKDAVEGPASSVLQQMGYTNGEQSRVLRLSSGWSTSADDWQALLEALATCYTEFKAQDVGSLSTVISL